MFKNRILNNYRATICEFTVQHPQTAFILIRLNLNDPRTNTEDTSGVQSSTYKFMFKNVKKNSLNS